MRRISAVSPLVVIVGETASGKTDYAIDLAQAFNGEIIAADSRTIYKGMDIGTAKPTPAQLHVIPHHLIDVVTPDVHISAAEYKLLAEDAADEVRRKGKLPFLVGGTGLYIDAIIYDFTFLSKPDPATREMAVNMSIEELQDELKRRHIPLPENVRNPRHLARRLESGGVRPARKPLRENTLILGLATNPEQRRERITKRVDSMFNLGLEEEARALFHAYGTDCPALRSIGYQEFIPYFTGQVSLESVRMMIIRNTLQYAKRQRTWFRRNKSIQWVDSKEETIGMVTTFLNKVYTA